MGAMSPSPGGRESNERGGRGRQSSYGLNPLNSHPVKQKKIEHHIPF